jgi:hypothetical protein
MLRPSSMRSKGPETPLPVCRGETYPRPEILTASSSWTAATGSVDAKGARPLAIEGFFQSVSQGLGETYLSALMVWLGAGGVILGLVGTMPTAATAFSGHRLLPGPGRASHRRSAGRTRLHRKDLASSGRSARGSWLLCPSSVVPGSSPGLRRRRRVVVPGGTLGARLDFAGRENRPAASTRSFLRPSGRHAAGWCRDRDPRRGRPALEHEFHRQYGARVPVGLRVGGAVPCDRHRFPARGPRARSVPKKPSPRNTLRHSQDVCKVPEARDLPVGSSFRDLGGRPVLPALHAAGPGPELRHRWDACCSAGDRQSAHDALVGEPRGPCRTGAAVAQHGLVRTACLGDVAAVRQPLVDRRRTGLRRARLGRIRAGPSLGAASDHPWPRGGRGTVQRR